jgi:hypothetical protein
VANKSNSPIQTLSVVTPKYVTFWYQKWLDWKALNQSDYWIEGCIAALYRHTMEMQQMMKRLVAEIRASHTEMDANLREIIADIRAW